MNDTPRLERELAEQIERRICAEDVARQAIAELAAAQEKIAELRQNYAVLEGAIEDRIRERDNLLPDASIGRVVWRYIDRMTDLTDRDSADRVLAAFLAEVEPIINAIIDAAREER